MPYFVRIGAIDGNKSGVGSRGYHLFRQGRIIIARWGAVQVLRGRSFRWIYRQERRYPMSSETAARAEYRKLLAIRAATYSRLPAGSSIR
jgi:hypothetical protein